MLALAFLAATRAAPSPEPASSARTGAGQLIAISANEIRRLFALLTRPPIDENHIPRWSHWRCQHQVRARWFHQQIRLATAYKQLS
ncbi:hypothetical protein [Nonomuraea sp. NPDC049141]|uniref:hypothetical protein n=1 Tax=unclassified Nonomuraea TaxID=2593643 RepID=UPI0033CB297F